VLASDADHDFVEVPDAAAARPLALEAASVFRSELQSPSAYRLIGNVDTALQQQLLNQA
jgi:hypothetical protein